MLLKYEFYLYVNDYYNLFMNKLFKIFFGNIEYG